MTNNQFIAAIENLIQDYRATAANPETRYIWLDRAEALEGLIESEVDPAILTAALRRKSK